MESSPKYSEMKARSSDLPKGESSAGLLVEQAWSAPLPPPGIFNKYPLEVQRYIVSSAEKEQDFRHRTIQKQLDSEVTQEKLNGLFAFIIMLLLIVVGGYLALQDKLIAAYLIGVGILLMITVYIYDIVKAFIKARKRKGSTSNS